MEQKISALQDYTQFLKKNMGEEIMSIIVSFFCGLCFYTLSDALADYISAKARMLEAQADALKVQNRLRELEAEKDKNQEGE